MNLRFSTALLALFLACACGTATPSDKAAGGGQGGVSFNGAARALVVPTTLATPTFAGVQANLVGFEALADGNSTNVATLGGAAVQSAASGCMAEGCAFNLRGIDLAGVSEGLFVRLAVPTGVAAGKWQEAYTLVANPNQVQNVKLGGGNLNGFVPATLPAAATVANLATLAGISPAELLARGATLAYVGKERNSGDTFGQGVTGAYVSLTPGVAGTSVVYPDDSYRRAQSNGTNADGAVLLVGPEVTTAAVASYAHPVAVKAAGSGIIYVNNFVFFRPGTLVLTTLLPQR